MEVLFLPKQWSHFSLSLRFSFLFFWWPDVTNPSAIIFKGFYLFIFREGAREGETEGEKHQGAREALISCLLQIPNQEPDFHSQQSTTQACALTRNWTSDLSACWTTFSPLNHASQGYNLFFILLLDQLWMFIWHALYDSGQGWSWAVTFLFSLSSQLNIFFFTQWLKEKAKYNNQTILHFLEEIL